MKKKQEIINDFLAFFAYSEKLKTIYRHSYTTDLARKESVADHSWMMALLTIILVEQINKKVDQLRAIKMAIVHDLAESLTGDIPAFEISNRQNTKQVLEIQALKKLISVLPIKSGKEILSLYKEFEDGKTLEAKFVQALDKIEVLMQHNIAHIDTWDDGDFAIGPYYKDHLFNFDEFIRALKDKVDEDTMKKIVDSETLNRVKPEHIEIYEEKKINYSFYKKG